MLPLKEILMLFFIIMALLTVVAGMPWGAAVCLLVIAVMCCDNPKDHF